MNIINRRNLLLLGAALSVAPLNSRALAYNYMNKFKGKKMPKPPITKKVPVSITQLGRTRTDNYGWLRDQNWQDVLNNPSKLSPEIKEHLIAESNYTKEVFLEPTKELQNELVKEMRGRIKEDDATPPAKNGNYAYYRKYTEGGQFPIIMRQTLENNKVISEQVLLDGDIEAKGLPFWKLINWQVNLPQDLMAYAIDFEGARNADIYFKDLKSGKKLDYKIEHTTGEIIFANDNKCCFYVKNDENVRPIKVMRHIIGTDPKEDVLIYEETDHAYFLGIDKSSSEDYLFLVSSASDNCEVRFIPLNSPYDAPILFSPRQSGFEYYPDHKDKYFYIRTNKDGAIDYKIMRTKIDKINKEEWVDFIPYNQGTLIEGFSLYKNYMVISQMSDALPRLMVYDFKKDTMEAIALNEEAYDLDFIGGFEFDTNITRFGYSSPTTPYETYDYNMETKERILLKTQIIPSGHNKNDYVVKRINAISPDGALIPVTILYKKTTPINGTAPLYLYGYGSYGISMPDGFNTNILNLVNRGFVYAIAHIRGGMERGYQWYLDGKLQKKKNTFNDFILCAQTLINQHYTAKGRIIAEGRSAGGLLMGAVANQAPDLFAGFIAGVAFVDMINTISDETLPLTPPEWTEWGNPLKNPQDYDYMASYSPYDNVKAQNYPPIFAQTALSDSQVTYWEPAKWIAKLREYSPNSGPFLLDVNMEAGHGGAPGRFDRLKEVAMSQAFALWCLG